ncbi:hypothetical protein [Yoonia sp. BS5-3]|uniref:PH domain-containing protein n=1 Tax=Yoonia phaeophyticola TaxID=3137369 RepID=A0ABZ2V8M1_9RHOB
MTEWMAQWGVAARYLLAHPGVLAIALGIALFKYWVMSRGFRRIARNQAKAQAAGWTQGAQVKQQRHETGIGTEQTLIMKPPGRLITVGLWTLVFFGGGAALLGHAVLTDPSARSFDNLLGAALCSGFALLALFLLGQGFTRIVLTQDSLTHRRLLRKTQVYRLDTINGARFAGKDPSQGIVLSFNDGRTLKLPAMLAGYADVMAQIKGRHPDLTRLLMIGQMVHNKRSRSAAMR